VLYELTETVGEVLEVILPLGEQDRRATFVDGGDDVVQDARIPSLVVRERAIDLLDADIGRFARHPEPRLPDDEPVVERAAGGMALRIHPEADGSELHLGDGLVPVSPLGSGGQAYEVTRLHLGEYALEGDCRQVVTGFPVFLLTNRVGKMSSRPRNSERKSLTFSAGVCGILPLVVSGSAGATTRAPSSSD
jgi:hypothetical protein